MKLADKVALVTGAGRGIGRAIAVKLAAEGAHVVINDLDPAPLEETAQEVRALKREAVTVAGDITKKEFPDAFIKAALDKFGRLDVIVNNAGFTWDNVIQKMGDDQWDTIVNVHLTAPFRILRAASGYIREAAKRDTELKHRKVVNVSSTSGVFGNAGQANYSSAKAGVIGLTKAMAKEWGRYRVNVNCVAFGLIETRLTQALGAEQAHIDVDGKQIDVGIQAGALAAMRQMIPFGRGGTPEEAAGSVALLCYPESDYISGQCITVAGGLF
jgi:3-oxoacyl-[acyl-carrier protein] reductase